MSQRTGIMCVFCDRQGITDSEMVTVSGNYSGGDGASMLRCTGQNHTIERNRLMAMKPRMKRLVVPEKQPPGTTPQSIWVYPQAWQRLAERFPANLQTTICSLVTALADDATMIIEGEHAREMHALAAQHGVSLARGRDILALLKTNIELARQMEELRVQQRVLEPFLRAMGAAGGAMQAGGNPVAGVLAAATAGQQAPEQPARPPQPQQQQLPPLAFNELGEASDAAGNFVEPPDALTIGAVPAASSAGGGQTGWQQGAGAVRPGGLPVPTPQRER